MITILIGIISSVAAEVVTAINKKLNGTVLQGDGAFLVAFAMALVGAIVKEASMPGFSLSTLTNIPMLTSTFTQIFTVSQVYFLFVVQKLSLDVPTETATKPAPANAGV